MVWVGRLWTEIVCVSLLFVIFQLKGRPSKKSNQVVAGCTPCSRFTFRTQSHVHHVNTICSSLCLIQSQSRLTHYPLLGLGEYEMKCVYGLARPLYSAIIIMVYSRIIKLQIMG